MRVAFVMTKLGTGGTANLVLQYGASLSHLGHDVQVIYLLENTDSVALSRFRAAGMEPVCVGHTRTLDHPRTVWRVTGLLRRSKVDIAHVLLPTAEVVGAIAGWFARKPVVATLVSTSDPRRHHRSVARAALRERLPRLAGVQNAAVSFAVADQATARGVKVSAVTYPGIADIPREPSRKVQQIRADIGVHSRGPMILSVGRLAVGKGHDTLIETLPLIRKHLPEAELVIAGDGPDRASLEHQVQAAQLGDSVKVLGLRDDVTDLLYACDVYASASVAEGLVGYATLEAALAERPIVGPDIPAVTELLEHGVHALLTDPTKPVDVAEAIVQIASDGPLGDRLGVAARTKVLANCSVETAALQLEKFYRAVLSG